MKRLTLVLFVMGCLLIADAAMAGVQLRFKFEKGKPLRYTLQMKSDADFATPDGQQQKMAMENYLEIAQELIEEKPNGDYRVAITIEKARQTVNGKVQPLFNVEGQTQLVTMKPTGQVAETVAPNPMQSGQLQMTFPSKELNQGDQWEQTQTIQNPIPMQLKTIYTLAKRDAAYPGYKGTTCLVKSKMQMENEPNEKQQAVSSRTMGNLWFDAEKGRIVRSKAVSKFKMKVPVQMPGLVPPNSTIDINIRLQIEIKLKSY